MNLIRIDDRLIHGQVSVGWCGYIKPKYMIIADDEIAADKNESELYLTGVPFECDGKVVSTSEAASFIKSNNVEPYIIVVKSLESALKLLKNGFEYKHLNLGGLHFAEGRKQINHYMFINESEIGILHELASLVPDIYLQDLPANSKYELDYIFNKWKEQ